MDFKVDIRAQHTATVENAISGRKARDLSKLKESCKEFEAIYVNEMYKAARKNIPESGLIKKSNGEKVFEEMLYMEQSRNIANNSSLGIADAMYRQMSDLIENRKE